MSPQLGNHVLVNRSPTYGPPLKLHWEDAGSSGIWGKSWLTDGKVVTSLTPLLPDESYTRPLLNVFLASAPKSTLVPWRAAGGRGNEGVLHVVLPWPLHFHQHFVLQTSDLSVVFKESTATTPLVFVLSPGTDPAAELYKFAEEMRFSQKLSAISLGQGQVSCWC